MHDFTVCISFSFFFVRTILYVNTLALRTVLMRHMSGYHGVMCFGHHDVSFSTVHRGCWITTNNLFNLTLVNTCTQTLPMFVACKPKPPVKSALCKIVLDTEYPAQPLTELFGDFLYAYQTSGECVYLRLLYIYVCAYICMLIYNLEMTAASGAVDLHIRAAAL